MTAPWYAYVLGLLIALPIFFLILVFAFGLVRGLFMWAFSSEAPAGPRVGGKGVPNKQK